MVMRMYRIKGDCVRPCYSASPVLGEIRAGVLVGPTLLGGFISTTLFPGQRGVGAARGNPAQFIGTRTYS
jgi:hypothetical protein